MNFQTLTKLSTTLSIAALVGACAASPPQQVTAAALPEAGPDGEYKVQFPRPAPAETRHLKMTVSEDVRHTCVLDEAHFAFDEASPRPQDTVHMKSLANCLNDDQFDNYDILLIGHADRRGSKDYNHDLAKRRALKVRQALIKHGVAPDRIRTQSRGERVAVGAKEGDFSHGFDRRVDVELIGRSHAPEESGVEPTLMPAGS